MDKMSSRAHIKRAEAQWLGEGAAGPACRAVAASQRDDMRSVLKDEEEFMGSPKRKSTGVRGNSL